MDHKEFDELVARITSAPSRRDALKGIFGGALASVGIDAASEAGDAAKKGRGDGKKGRGKKHDGKKHDGKKHDDAGAEGGNNKRKRRKKKCKLQPGQTRCSRKVCVDLQNNSAHCGSCGNACETGQFCLDGVCTNGS